MSQPKSLVGNNHIEDNKVKLQTLSQLLDEYGIYTRLREHQPLAARLIFEVRGWVDDNIAELKEGR